MRIEFTLEPTCEGSAWLEEQPDAQTAWANCERGDWMWWALMHLEGAMPERETSAAFARWNDERAKKHCSALADFYPYPADAFANITAARYASVAVSYAAYACSYAANVAGATAAEYTAYLAAERKAQADWIRKHVKCPII